MSLLAQMTYDFVIANLETVFEKARGAGENTPRVECEVEPGAFRYQPNADNAQETDNELSE